MARRGAAPGERRGGRAAGVPNRKTIENLAKAERRFEEAKAVGEKLGIDVLRDFMKAFQDKAAYHQPIPDGVEIPRGRKPDEPLFAKYGKLAIEAAGDLAQYETPKLRAILVAGGPMMPGAAGSLLPPPTLDAVANENDPGKLYRVYQQVIGGQRKPPSATR